MDFVKQSRPMFVPFQDRKASFEPSKREKLFMRRFLISIVVFLISVTVVSFVTNKFEEKVREAQAAARTCQAAVQSDSTLAR